MIVRTLAVRLKGMRVAEFPTHIGRCLMHSHGYLYFNSDKLARQSFVIPIAKSVAEVRPRMVMLFAQPA